MNKKISILTIILTGFLGTSVFAQTSGNVGKLTGDASSQGNINIQRNVEQRATKLSDGTVGASAKALTTETGLPSDERSKWNSNVLGSHYHYQVKDSNGNLLENCTGNGERCNNILKYTTDENGYLSTGPGIQTHTDDSNIPVGFYRYYIVLDDNIKAEYQKMRDGEILPNDGKHPCEITEGKLGGCWSPIYPIVAFDGFKGISDLKKFTDDNTKRKNYFGERTEYYKTGPEHLQKLVNIDGEGRVISAGVSKVLLAKNQYSSDKYSKDKYPDNKEKLSYRMGVKVVGEKWTDDAGKQVSTGSMHPNTSVLSTSVATGTNPNSVGGDAVLSVQRWSRDGDGLKPDFNYAGLGYGDSNANLNTYELSDVKSIVQSQRSVLPCGMFEDSSKPTGVSENPGVKCNDDNYIRISKDNNGNQLYTSYFVALPTSNGFETKYKENQKLNYRTCARCSSLNNEDNCKKLVLQLIEKDNIRNLESLVAKMRSGFSNQKIANGNDTGYATYTGNLSCSNCLGKLDEILKDSNIMSKLECGEKQCQ